MKKRGECKLHDGSMEKLQFSVKEEQPQVVNLCGGHEQELMKSCASNEEVVSNL